MKKGDHLFLVDGSGYIFRAYHALPPLTRKSDGLPVGLQLIGRGRADADVLAASAAFEQLRPWASTYRICHNLPAAGATGSAGENEAMHGSAL